MELTHRHCVLDKLNIGINITRVKCMKEMNCFNITLKNFLYSVDLLLYIISFISVILIMAA